MKVGILLFLIFGIWIGLGVLSPATVQAELITIGIEAVVDDVQDPDNYLEGLVNVGDLITGTYTYDTDTPDSSSSSQVGRYEHYAYPCGISLSVGGLDFATDPADTDFVIRILNDYLYDDFYWLTSYSNLPVSNGTSVNNIDWMLGDPSETAISTVELPTTGPVLDDWEVNFLNIGGGIRSREGFVFLSHVTSAVVIPEPTTMLLLGLGGLIFVRRAKK